ncbi:MAG: hypothetical protein ACOYEO_00630 [bacterium]
MRPKPSLTAAWRSGLRSGSLTMGLSLLLGVSSGYVVRVVPLFLAFLVLFAIILLGILFDIMGVAVTVAEEPPLHAMAAKRLPGARQAVRLLRQAPAVSNFCNDLVGDMAGTLSGATGATIVFSLAKRYPNLREEWLSLLVIALISALTVGGKAISKHFSIQQANDITLKMGRALFLVEKIIGRELLAKSNRRG